MGKECYFCVIQYFPRDINFFTMQLQLKNPIVFFDLETTGVNIATDRIVEISILKVHINGTEESRTYKVNPEMPIPPQASAIHGITDEDVRDAPTFKAIARELARFMEGCDIGGYNSIHKMERRTLEAAYKFYCDKDLKDAHSAEADTKATYEVLKAQLERYPDLKNDVAFLADFSNFSRNVDFAGRIVYNDKDEEVFNFGKYKGVKVEEVLEKDPGYYGWIMNGDFPLYTKKVITNIKLRKFNNQ